MSFSPTSAELAPAEVDSGMDGWGPGLGSQHRAAIPQSSVVSKHFCFKAASPAEAGAELVTASTKNGAGGEMSSLLPSPSFPVRENSFPASPLGRTVLGTIQRGVITDVEDT